MHQVRYEAGHGVRRRRAVWAKTIQIYLVARVQRAGDRPGRSGIGQHTFRGQRETAVRLTVCSQLPCSPRFRGRFLSSLAGGSW